VKVTVTLPDTGANELRTLYGYLRQEFELRGQVRLAESEPQPGTLGGVTDALIVALGHGGVGVALAGALVVWLRGRVGDVVCKITHPDGYAVELSTKRLQNCDDSAIQRIVQELSRSLDGKRSASDGDPGQVP
jgi:hypothetical protein